MSISGQIDRINENVANTYTALESMGADMPSYQNTNNLVPTVMTIKAVRYDEQTLTDDQKAQARTNIGIDRLFCSMIPYGTAIPASVDLNATTYLKVGNYYCSKNADVATMTNCPTTMAFMMQVYSPLSTTIDNETSKTWVYRLRKIIDHKGGEWYQDVYSGSTAGSFTYSAWKKIIKDTDTATTSKVGVVKLTNSISSTSTTTAATPNSVKAAYDKAAQVEKALSRTSVTDYGATGDGATDDTTAFENALAENRTVFVPGGTYKLSRGISIGDNCELELAQDAVLNFTQISGNCITLNMCSSLKGNHATVNVTYAFNGNVLYAYSADTTKTEERGVPPFTKWSPQWKSGRYVTDLNICKADYRGFHYAVNAEDCCGTAVYLSANIIEGYVSNMWGIHYSGLRIAGAFEYGIRAVNFNEGWLHEMRVDAFIDACEIGVSLEDCNQAYVSAIIQPRRALLEGADGEDDEDYVPYAKHGIKLIRSINADLSGSRVWDWNSERSLYGTNPQYQHIAMYGDCSGAIINDFAYYESGDTRNRIYTDTPSNLEKLTILQEPFTRWFRQKEGVPYFYDGNTDKKLTTEDEMKALFGTTMMPKFTNQLPIATDTDGTIFNGKGYKEGCSLGGMYPPTVDEGSAYYYITVTGFIPVKKGSVLRFKNLKWARGDGGAERIVFYKTDKSGFASGSYAMFATSPKIDTYSTVTNYTETDDGFELTMGTTTSLDGLGYVRVSFMTNKMGTNPVITVDEQIVYEQVGVLSDGIKISADSVIGGLTTSDVNDMISSAISGAIGGSY